MNGENGKDDFFRKQVDNLINRDGSKKKHVGTIAIDFDGVIHSYTSGWQGDAVIPDPPTPGAAAAIRLLKQSFVVVIFSTRASTAEGLKAIRAFCQTHNIPYDDITAHKPPAWFYIDDKGLRFHSWPQAIADMVFAIADDPRVQNLRVRLGTDTIRSFWAAHFLLNDITTEEGGDNGEI